VLLLESKQNLKQNQEKNGKGGRMEETIIPPFWITLEWG
jgi:hypothetical protein